MTERELTGHPLPTACGGGGPATFFHPVWMCARPWAFDASLFHPLELSCHLWNFQWCHTLDLQSSKKDRTRPSASTASHFIARKSEALRREVTALQLSRDHHSLSHPGLPPENHTEATIQMVPAKGSRKFWLRNTSSSLICGTEAEAFFRPCFNYDSIGDSLAFFPRAKLR